MSYEKTKRALDVLFVATLGAAGVLQVAEGCEGDSGSDKAETTPDLPISTTGVPAHNKEAAAHNAPYLRVACKSIFVTRSGNTLSIDTTLEPAGVQRAWVSYEIQSTEPKVEGDAQGSPIGEDPVISLAGVGRAARLFATVQIPHGNDTMHATCDTVGVPRV